MIRALLIAVALTLASCGERPVTSAPPIDDGRAMHDGGPVVTPPQWIDYCHRNPTDPSCSS